MEKVKVSRYIAGKRLVYLLHKIDFDIYKSSMLSCITNLQLRSPFITRDLRLSPSGPVYIPWECDVWRFLA